MGSSQLHGTIAASRLRTLRHHNSCGWGGAMQQALELNEPERVLWAPRASGGIVKIAWTRLMQVLPGRCVSECCNAAIKQRERVLQDCCYQTTRASAAVMLEGDGRAMALCQNGHMRVRAWQAADHQGGMANASTGGNCEHGEQSNPHLHTCLV